MARPIPVNRHSDASSSGCCGTIALLALLLLILLGCLVLVPESSAAGIIRPVEHLTAEVVQQTPHWAAEAVRKVQPLANDAMRQIQRWLQTIPEWVQSHRASVLPVQPGSSIPISGIVPVAPSIRASRIAKPTPLPTRTPSMHGSVTAWWLNLRAGPGMEFTILEQLPRGTRLEILGQQGIWLRVRVVKHGTLGWVSSYYVEVTTKFP